MIERLQQVLTRIEQLPPELQEEIAAQLEVLTEPFEEISNAKTNKPHEKSKSLAGVWRDLAWDDEAEAFDRMRHATQPTPLTHRAPRTDNHPLLQHSERFDDRVTSAEYQ
jgi:hypothetical protein